MPSDRIGSFSQVRAFHDEAGLTIKSYTARKVDNWYLLYCFADRKNAVAFQLAFGGEIFDRSLDQRGTKST